jgi:hypothetical protein
MTTNNRNRLMSNEPTKYYGVLYRRIKGWTFGVDSFESPPTPRGKGEKVFGPFDTHEEAGDVISRELGIPTDAEKNKMKEMASSVR